MSGNWQSTTHGPERGRIPVDGKAFPYTIKHAFREGEFVTESEKIEAIVDYACELFTITRRELCGEDKQGRLVNARILVSNALRQLTDLTYPAIGRVINRDHSTVIFHVKHYRRADEVWPPAWVGIEITYIKRLLLRQMPTWQLLHDLGEALGFLKPAVAAVAGVKNLAKAA